MIAGENGYIGSEQWLIFTQQMQFAVPRNSFPFKLYKLPGIYKTERMGTIQP